MNAPIPPNSNLLVFCPQCKTKRPFQSFIDLNSGIMTPSCSDCRSKRARGWAVVEV